MIALILDEEEEEEGDKRMWVHQAWRNRATEGEFATLYKELMDDGTKFFEYFRMSEYSFNLLLSKLEGSLKNQDARCRKAITAKERLAVCLSNKLQTQRIDNTKCVKWMGNTLLFRLLRRTDHCSLITKRHFQ